jgi:cytochrome c oxidase subunit 4
MLVPTRTYFGIFLALLVLTAVTVAVATVNLGAWNTVVMLTVASAKALLVVLYFMHLRWTERLSQVVLLGGLFWLFVLVAITMADYISRAWV